MWITFIRLYQFFYLSLYHQTKTNYMASKMIYVTKKQVSDFITRETVRLKISKAELLKEVENALDDLKLFPIDNRNQIKYFTRIYNTLKLNQYGN